MKLRSILFLSVAFFSTQASALDPAACNAAAKQIDDRIAVGNHPQQNVAIATQLREGIVQSCAFLDEATLAQMLQGLDQILPSGDAGSVVAEKSAAEREAEREAQRVEADRRQAEREKRRAAERAREQAEQDLVSDVLRKPPAGRVAKGQLMSRSDKMWRASIVDWDIYQDRARLLYMTGPSREQGRLPDAAQHYYVVEFDPNDKITQQHIVQAPRGRRVTAGLIRGRDELILQWHEGGNEATESTLERWSISKAKMVGRSPAPRLQGPKGALVPDNHFQLATPGGDLLYVSTVALESGPSPKTGVSWMLASPEGQVLDQASIVHDDEKVAANDWFHSANGRVGLILDISSVGESSIDSQLKPAAVRVGSADIRPMIMSERRLYVVGGSEKGAEMPAFGRSVVWLGLENVDQSLMINGESTRLMDEAEGKYRFRDSTVGWTVAGRIRVAVAPSRGGHAVLIINNHRDDAFPPTRGLWLQEFAAGKPRRDTYLNPDAEYLETQLNMLASDGDDNLYIASRQHVILLDAARRISAYAESSADTAEIKAMIADGNSVWLFGEHHGNRDSLQQVWVERIQF